MHKANNRLISLPLREVYRMENKYLELKKIVNDLQSDIEKVVGKNNKSAGIRVRKAMLDIKDLAQQIRKDILDSKKI